MLQFLVTIVCDKEIEKQWIFFQKDEKGEERGKIFSRALQQ